MLKLRVFAILKNEDNFSHYAKDFSYNLRLAYTIIMEIFAPPLIEIVDNFMVGNFDSTIIVN